MGRHAVAVDGRLAWLDVVPAAPGEPARVDLQVKGAPAVLRGVRRVETWDPTVVLLTSRTGTRRVTVLSPEEGRGRSPGAHVLEHRPGERRADLRDLSFGEDVVTGLVLQWFPGLTRRSRRRHREEEAAALARFDSLAPARRQALAALLDELRRAFPDTA